MFSSCGEDEVVVVSATTSLPSYRYDTDSVLMVNGKRMQWFFNAPKKSLSKGILADETGPDWEYGYATFDDDTTHKFKTMKVYKRNDPEKYFYVMLTNLDINSSSGCWAYNDDQSLVAKYGRLYTWHKADELKTKVHMDLPIYRKNGTVFSEHFQTPARLMTIEDVCDIIEMDTIGHMTQYGYQLNSTWVDPMYSYFYYDAFVFGPEFTTNHADAQHSLGGVRAVEWATGIDRYRSINMNGGYWLSDRYVDTDMYNHFPLTIERQYGSNLYDYSAYINCMVRNESGNSVRYVFEPVYRNR